MFIRIETTSGVPITRQIVDQIRMACATGALGPGDRLPSVRVLARELAVNQNTILRVYERLAAEGLLDRRHGDGTYVAKTVSADQLRHQHELLGHEAQRLAARAAALGMDADQLGELINGAYEELGVQSGKTQGDRHE